MPPDEQPLSPEPANNELPRFSEPEIIPNVSQTQDAPTATLEAKVSLAGTSPLLTNPSLTDVPSSIPLLPDGISNLQDTEARNTGLSGTAELAARYNVLARVVGAGCELLYLVRGSTQATNSQCQDLRLRSQRRSRRGRHRGRPTR